MTIAIDTTSKTGRLAFCSPLCRDPSRTGTRRISLSALVVTGQGGSPHLQLDPCMAIMISTQDGHALQVDLDASTAAAFHTAVSAELSKVGEGHAPAPHGLLPAELGELRFVVRKHVEGIPLVQVEHLIPLLCSVRSHSRVRIAALLARMRPDLLESILHAMLNIG